MIFYFSHLPESTGEICKDGVHLDPGGETPIILALTEEGAVDCSIYTLGLDNLAIINLTVFKTEVPDEYEKYLSLARTERPELKKYIYLAFWHAIPPEWITSYRQWTATAKE